MRRILLVDDDVELCDLLTEYLSAENFEVTCVHDGQAGVEQVQAREFEVVVLDVMMPRLNGFDALQQIRSDSGVPVLMLTARGDDVDRIVGLEMGADDYLPKPCNPRELVARLRAILRRTAAAADREPAEGSGALRLGDVTVDSSSRSVLRGGQDVQLTGAEFSILGALMAKPGEVVSKDELSRSALARAPSAYDRSIDVHVSRIRKKLGDHPDGSTRIRSVRGAGYLYAMPSGGEQDG